MDNKNFNLQEVKEDKRIALTLMSSFIVLSLQYLFIFILKANNIYINDVINIISKLIVGLFFLINFPIVFRRIKIKFIIIYFIAIFLYLLNFVLFVETREVLLASFISLFFISIPSLVYMLSIKNLHIFKDVMYKYSYIIFIIGIVIAILNITGSISLGPYSMTLSYYMLLPCLVYLDRFFGSYNARMIIFSLISIIVIIAFGSRGPLLCIGVFIIMKIFLNWIKIKTFKGFFINGIIIIFSLIFLIFYKYIFNVMYDILLNMGIKSRTIRLLMESEVELSGRENLYNDSMQSILSNPWIGNGIYSDRLTLNTYIHNFFLEIFMNFGVFLGLILIICLVVIIIKAQIIDFRKKFNLVPIWISLGFVHLMVSSSYLIDIKFWIFVGLLINVCFLQNGAKKNLSGS